MKKQDRKYSNFYSWKERWKPRWLEHLTQNAILQQDMAIITGQHDNVEASDSELNELWNPLKTSDRLVLAYRRWIDEYQNDHAFYRGYRTSVRHDVAGVADFPSDTYRMHTQQCADCTQVYRFVKGSQFWGKGIAAMLLVGSVVSEDAASTGAFGLAFLATLSAVAGLARFQKVFE